MPDQERGSKRKNSGLEMLPSATGGKESNPPEGCKQILEWQECMVPLMDSRTFRSSHRYPQEFPGCNLAMGSNHRNYSLRNLGLQMVCWSQSDPKRSIFPEFLIRLHAMGEMESCHHNGGSLIQHRT